MPGQRAGLEMPVKCLCRGAAASVGRVKHSIEWGNAIKIKSCARALLVDGFKNHDVKDKIMGAGNIVLLSWAALSSCQHGCEGFFQTPLQGLEQ